MHFLKGLSPRTVGIGAAVITVAIWTAFIVIARASAQGSLTPFDIALARIMGASLLRAFEGGEVWTGDLLFMCAALSGSACSVLARRHGLDAVRATAAITVFALFSYLPSYALLLGVLQSHLLTAPVGEVLFQVLFQGLGSVVISGITFVRMIQYFGPVRSTMITARVPGLSALGAVVFLGEPLYGNLMAGLVLVTVGILFGVRKTVAIKTEAVDVVSTRVKPGLDA